MQCAYTVLALSFQNTDTKTSGPSVAIFHVQSMGSCSHVAAVFCFLLITSCSSNNTDKDLNIH